MLLFRAEPEYSRVYTRDTRINTRDTRIGRRVWLGFGQIAPYRFLL